MAVARLPGWLQVWARHNPVTIRANPIRADTFGSRFAAAMGETVLSLTTKSAIWIAMILAVFVPLSIRVYRRS